MLRTPNKPYEFCQYDRFKEQDLDLGLLIILYYIFGTAFTKREYSHLAKFF